MSRAKDWTALLSFAGPALNIFFGLYVVTFVTLAITSGSIGTGWGVGALVSALVAAALVSRAGPYPLALGATATILLLVVLTTALGVLQLSAFEPPGFRAWHLGAANFVLFAVALRGRIASAWIGMGLVCITASIWSVLVTGNALHGIDLVYGQASSLFAGTFFSVLLRRTAKQIFAFEEIQVQNLAQEHLIQESEREREHQLEQLRRMVEVPLQKIASGRVSDEEREEHRLLEAFLRDQIRGKALHREPLISAVDEARRRGVDVLLLDDSTGESPTTPLDEASSWAAQRLRSTQADEVVIRVSSDESGIVVSVSAGVSPADTRLFATGADRTTRTQSTHEIR